MKPKDILIQGGRVVDPSQELDDVRDVLISRGLIAEVGEHLDPGKTDVLDASRMIVMPGLIDMHTHLREPGSEESETIQSGCRAAARGGFTAVCAMPNTEPPTDDAGRVEFILDRSEGAEARVYPCGAITRGRAGKEIVEMNDMAEAGAVAFSDDGVSIEDAYIMYNALRYANMIGRPIIAHEEDANLDRSGHMNESSLSVELGLRGMPGIAEETMVMRDIAIAEYTGTSLHVTHISTAKTVAIIREAKARGIRITCDVTPHHLALTEDRVRSYDTRYKMNPPLRSREDIEAIHEGLVDGTIDAIATDHAPHYIEQKELEFIEAAFGVTGLETALGVVQHVLVNSGILPWSAVVEKMSHLPARILGVQGGTLAPGTVGDVTIYDPDTPWQVDPHRMVSKSSNTAFFDWTLPGKTFATVVGGILHRSSENTNA